MQQKNALSHRVQKSAETQDWRGIAARASRECPIKCGAPAAQKR
jgi:hypothetical protein